jgi:aromatic ring-opening dioxygenase catalytic subunit (LigB family)
VAEIVGAFAVGHAPNAPGDVSRLGAGSEYAPLFAGVSEHLEAVDPDVIVMFDTDHFATFFYDNLPTFAVGIADHTSGPGTDRWPGLPSYENISVEESLARLVHKEGIEEGFDLAASFEFGVDHSIVVPLHFLNPGMRRPIVPIWINGIAPPIPQARRCYDLGTMVQTAIRSWPKDLRVAVVASGSISGDIGGPRARDHQPSAAADGAWMHQVLGRLSRGEVSELLNEATTERIAAAGNVSGELLNWIALLAVVGEHRPAFLEAQLDAGFAYAAWRFDR